MDHLGSPYTTWDTFTKKKSKIFYFLDLSQFCTFPPYTKLGHLGKSKIFYSFFMSLFVL